MTSLLNRIRQEPPSAPARYRDNLFSPDAATPRTVAARTKDPNAPDYRYQVNQKCIYERHLPGGSHITAHIQRLQSGFYDSPVVHEDCIDNVRFVAVHFVFHPSSSRFRFTWAEIKIALHHAHEDDARLSASNVADILPVGLGSHNHGTQTSRHPTREFDTPSRALVRSTDVLPAAPQPAKKPVRPKFLRHAPHILYGAVSPETLDWNFNLAGSLGVSQGPANASLQPSVGVKGSYKLYQMMRIQGSVRTLRHWAGKRNYDVEDGELVWTLEENKLQKSGLPREFTFVMMLTKGSGPIDFVDDVELEIDIKPKVAARLGGSYPMLVTEMPRFQPFKQDRVDLNDEIGQRFEPEIPGKGFNFANIATNFDDFMYLPGTTFSTNDNQMSQVTQPQPTVTQAQLPQSQTQQQGQPLQHQSSHLPRMLSNNDNTLNLRVFLESSRSNPALVGTSQQPYVTLKAPAARSHSPLPAANPGTAAGTTVAHNPKASSIAPSHKSTGRRSIIITSNAQHSRSRSQPHPQPPSASQEASTPKRRNVSQSHSLRRSYSRSSLVREYQASSSPSEPRIVSIHESITSSHSTARDSDPHAQDPYPSGHGVADQQQQTDSSTQPRQEQKSQPFSEWQAETIPRGTVDSTKPNAFTIARKPSQGSTSEITADKAQSKGISTTQQPPTFDIAQIRQTQDPAEDGLARTGTLDQGYEPQATANLLTTASTSEGSRKLTITNPDPLMPLTPAPDSSQMGQVGENQLAAQPIAPEPTIHTSSNSRVPAHTREVSDSSLATTDTTTSSASTQLRLSPDAANPRVGVWNDTPASWANDSSFHTAPLANISREGSIRTTGSRRSARKRYAYPEDAVVSGAGKRYSDAAVGAGTGASQGGQRGKFYDAEEELPLYGDERHRDRSAEFRKIDLKYGDEDVAENEESRSRGLGAEEESSTSANAGNEVWRDMEDEEEIESLGVARAEWPWSVEGMI